MGVVVGRCFRFRPLGGNRQRCQASQDTQTDAPTQTHAQYHQNPALTHDTHTQASRIHDHDHIRANMNALQEDVGRLVAKLVGATRPSTGYEHAGAGVGNPPPHGGEPAGTQDTSFQLHTNHGYAVRSISHRTGRGGGSEAGRPGATPTRGRHRSAGSSRASGMATSDPMLSQTESRGRRRSVPELRRWGWQTARRPMRRVGRPRSIVLPGDGGHMRG